MWYTLTVSAITMQLSNMESLEASETNFYIHLQNSKQYLYFLKPISEHYPQIDYQRELTS